MRRLTPCIAFVSIAALFAAQPALAQAPSTMTSEVLADAPMDQLTGTCNPAGTTTLNYRVSGLAIGPYAGPYLEQGTVTIGPQTLPRFISGFQAGPLTSVRVGFVIFSPLGLVVGTKTLLPQPADAIAACYDPAPGQTFRVVCACGAWSLSYSAQIQTPSGRFRDEGLSDLQFQRVTVTGFVPQDQFSEVFRSSLLEPVPVPPGDDDDHEDDDDHDDDDD